MVGVYVTRWLNFVGFMFGFTRFSNASDAKWLASRINRVWIGLYKLQCQCFMGKLEHPKDIITLHAKMTLHSILSMFIYPLGGSLVLLEQHEREDLKILIMKLLNVFCHWFKDKTVSLVPSSVSSKPPSPEIYFSNSLEVLAPYSIFAIRPTLILNAPYDIDLGEHDQPLHPISLTLNVLSRLVSPLRDDPLGLMSCGNASKHFQGLDERMGQDVQRGNANMEAFNQLISDIGVEKLETLGCKYTKIFLDDKVMVMFMEQARIQASRLYIKKQKADLEGLEISLEDYHDLEPLCQARRIAFANLVTLKTNRKYLFYQKLRVQWICEGDESSKLFHSTINLHKCNNDLSRLLQDDSSFVGVYHLKDRIINHFSNFYAYESPHLMTLDDVHIKE
ncbi:hypothetical protein VNO77_19448 [Canavalia gladiata]|uniref:Uncharacterized protein n=1 Tax=Canavalia gladiata TaxID=3824 RepID=A0AAN9LND9_CANGL